MYLSIHLAVYLPVCLSLGDAVGAVGVTVTPHRWTSIGTHVIQYVDSIYMAFY